MRRMLSTGPKTLSLKRLIFGDDAPVAPIRTSNTKSRASSATPIAASRIDVDDNGSDVPLTKTHPHVIRVGSGSGTGTGTSPGADTGGTGTSTAGMELEGHDDVTAVPAPDVIDVDDRDEATTACGKRAKKCTSDVWNYFTKRTEVIEVDGMTYIQLWGYCKFPKCKAKYIAECNYGTSGFHHHLKSVHSIVKGQQQLKTEKDHGKDITFVEPYRYDQELSLRKLYLAIIMYEYPFSIVEHDYFVAFIKSLCPSFPMKSRVTVRKELMEIYLEEKEKLSAHFKSVQCCFSATMDMWTSCQNKSYICVTLHWVDDEWRLQKRIAGFLHVEGQHSGQKLSQTFTEVMIKWYAEKKLFSLILDNASANQVAVQDIIADLRDSGITNLVCDGVFFHVRCVCHILNLVARDGLAVISKTVDKIKAIVLVVKSSPLQQEQLMKRATECGLDTARGLSLDVSTRWNSTYLMLRDALYYRPAFLRLKSSDRKRYKHISPSSEEWEMALTLFRCLKKFYDLTEILSGTSYPTANLFYRGFCEIKDLLDTWCVSSDFTIRNMAVAMSAKFEKYWNMSSTALVVACFIDPRYKKRLIEFYMKKFHGPGYQVQLEEFLSIIKKLYHFYAAAAAPSTVNARSNATENSKADDILDTPNDELDAFLYETNDLDDVHMDELDKYMAGPLLNLKGHFDILSWWRDSARDFPILAQIARDVLAIQVLTVASEYAFSAGGRVIDLYRSRLDSEMVQALICTKDWVAAARKDSKNLPSLVEDLELMEAISAALKREMVDQGNEEEGDGVPNIDVLDDIEEV